MGKGWAVKVMMVSLVVVVVVGAGDKSGLAKECSKDVQSVMTCLGFAQGKMEKPSKECCSSVSSINEEEPKCLCYILRQTTSGAQNLKSFGVQQDKLLQLPSACQLKNASITACPKLLGLAPNSPDAAIFTNSSTTPTTPSTGTPSSASENAGKNCGGTKLETAHLVGFTLLVATASFIHVLPPGFASLF